MYVKMTYTASHEDEDGTLDAAGDPRAGRSRSSVLDLTGESLNEYVVRHAVEAAHEDLADRRVFVVDEAAWTSFQAVLDRPPRYTPRLANLLANPSVLEQPTGQ